VLGEVTLHLRIILSLGILLSCAIVQAADESNQFAIKGMGLHTCESFVEARKAQSPRYFQFGGWMNGYISAANRYENHTFDLVSWHSTGMLSTALANFCEQNPQLQFARAVALLLNSLGPDRLQSQSELIEAKVGEKSVFLYRATLLRAQQSLVDQRHMEGTPDGEFDAPSREAFQSFQRASGLEETGLPDQATLAKLFN
jgi:hypothetical protein